MGNTIAQLRIRSCVQDFSFKKSGIQSMQRCKFQSVVLVHRKPLFWALGACSSASWSGELQGTPMHTKNSCTSGAGLVLRKRPTVQGSFLNIGVYCMNGSIAGWWGNKSSLKMKWQRGGFSFPSFRICLRPCWIILTHFSSSGMLPIHVIVTDTPSLLDCVH